MTADYDIMHSGVHYPAGTPLPTEVLKAHGLVTESPAPAPKRSATQAQPTT